jgi:hypothetical protein
MKLRFLVFVIALLLTMHGSAQFNFSIGTGLQQNGAVFGYKYKKFVPQLGFQMLRASSSFTETGKERDTATDEIVPYTSTFKFTGSVFIPTIGLKYFFLERGNLKAYGSLNFSKLILKAKIDDSEDPKADDELQKQLKNINIYGGQLAFGTEYFLDEHFSVGGEFGLMMIHIGYKNEYDDELYDFNTGNMVSFKVKQDLKLNASPTYGKMSLNFYFGK